MLDVWPHARRHVVFVNVVEFPPVTEGSEAAS
jgi:hypothetical protein